MENNIKDRNIFTCCRQGSNCPTVEKIGDEFIINDDFGGIVKMNAEQFSMLKEAEEFFIEKI